LQRGHVACPDSRIPGASGRSWRRDDSIVPGDHDGDIPAEEQGLAMSVWGMGMLTSPLQGPTLGGWITYNWTWRWCFYINLPIGICAVLMVIAFVHDPEHIRKSQAATRKIDFLGIIYLALGLGLLQIVLDRGQRADWFDASWVCMFTIIAASSLILFVFHELRFPEPILDLSIAEDSALRHCRFYGARHDLRRVWAQLVESAFFQELLGYSPWKSGCGVAARLRQHSRNAVGGAAVAARIRHPMARTNLATTAPKTSSAVTDSATAIARAVPIGMTSPYPNEVAVTKLKYRALESPFKSAPTGGAPPR